MFLLFCLVNCIYDSQHGCGILDQVRAAILAIRYTEHFPRLPADFEISGQRDADMFDLLEYVFGFQVCIYFLTTYIWFLTLSFFSFFTYFYLIVAER